MLDYPPRIPLAQLPTPLQPLRRLQQQIGGPLVWVKRDDMTGATLTGNKVRKLEFIFARAQDEGYSAVITCGGIQSNHCRATALAAAQLGFDCHLILRGVPTPGQPAQGNQFLDELAGASLQYCEPRDYIANLDTYFAQRAADCRAEGKRALAIPTGGSNGVGIWGYIAATEELLADCALQGIEPAAIVCATGSGGTQAGLTVGTAATNPAVRVFGIAVCDDEAYFIDKIQRDITEWRALYPQAGGLLDDRQIQVNVIDDYIGAGYGQAGKDVLDTIQLLASLEGIVLDPVYTGKAFNGLLTEIQQGRFAGENHIVFVHTGGIFGLMPYAGKFFAK
ncbi:MAG: D-cysteine desulfhydrase family protein [Pseudomonadales bacterium]|nr:D-cysteine desulfhydrase family protein [Gammaproteobacteria bacterium]NNL57825.1 D-cysteine desulfhydrase family protein [Pseudomonadales bacterium]